MLSSSGCGWRLLCSRCLGLLPRTAVNNRLRPPLAPPPPGFKFAAANGRQARFQSSASTAIADDPESQISPVLLERARAIATEHQQLAAANANNYDVTTAKRIGELSSVAKALKEWEDAQNSLSELQSLLDDPSSDAEILSLARSDIESTLSQLPSLTAALKKSLIPPHPFANLGCMIEIHPGAGGSEASLFAHTLLEMYRGMCARKKWPTQLTSYTPDDSVSDKALTEALLEVEQPGSYEMLRSEAGVHRVQRVPATEKKGRTHTSAVSVLVLPNLPDTSSPESELDYEDPNSDYYIAPQDVRSETMRARGAGGQHVNKTDSAVRLTHIPTGIVVAMQDSRSQHKNRDKAWQLLRAKIAQLRREQRDAEVTALRRSVMGGVAKSGREDKVRTYNYSQNRVTDHRSGAESSDLDGVLAGDVALERIMESVREWMAENEVRGLLAEEQIKANAKAREGEDGKDGKSNGNGKK
ncbi:Peptide chain release factor 1, mitochondrial [Exophiala dermatitidis]|uniref:Peptide chain release factor 1, mitochondrial n=1 Tax=Exophiala dermatitidis TaxID=5970 RepID=A0AAN6EQY1_EXODE|nr:Peptide chain release factor 1, mitochondrial [Exophiala dermatitidis]KAJ4510421.1 Peptide chain release factor 1, mitochondrial [Exophiala dermatitidis]KAJ4510645.1 Peptide chain release factor 1, mitochondrial [Exophiala dermatitidis]KAJ4535029.1 Peptide chain release factor 1, mitochondrial [Exophiala dermatitidis]KAJ4536098.1 Peptide chain release factor 1, mitochondrial [Exophiala dermatitidis]